MLNTRSSQVLRSHLGCSIPFYRSDENSLPFCRGVIDAKKDEAKDKDQRSAVASILAKIPTLTVREAEVLNQILRAQKNDEIANALFISEKTVRNHIHMIYEKLGIHNRLKLMSHVRGLGIELDG